MITRRFHCLQLLPQLLCKRGCQHGQRFRHRQLDLHSDTLNRVISGVASSGSCNGMTITWGYDAGANRLKQTATGSASCTIAQPNFAQANLNNTPPGYTYDADGDTLTDANGNTFTYDAEGRIYTVTNSATKYLYDAEGRRVAKENSSIGAVTASYALSLGGDELAEMNGSECGSTATSSPRGRSTQPMARSRGRRRHEFI